MFEKHTDVESRLVQFRQIRKDAQSVKDVLEAFSTVKIHSRYLDYYTPKEWMKPFDIIENGYFLHNWYFYSNVQHIIEFKVHRTMSNFVESDK